MIKITTFKHCLSTFFGLKSVITWHSVYSCFASECFIKPYETNQWRLDIELYQTSWVSIRSIRAWKASLKSGNETTNWLPSDQRIYKAPTRAHFTILNYISWTISTQGSQQTSLINPRYGGGQAGLSLFIITRSQLTTCVLLSHFYDQL